MTHPMTQPMTPREKVAEIVESAILRHFPSAVISDTLDDADAILAALASGSGDHAELARLAEIAAAVEFGAGNGISFREEGAVTLAADIRALIAENAALRSERDRAEGRIRDLAAMFGVCDGGRYLNDWKVHCDRATEAERKLAEAEVGAKFISRLLPTAAGLDDAPDNKVIAFYINMRELRQARTFLSSTEAERG